MSRTLQTLSLIAALALVGPPTAQANNAKSVVTGKLTVVAQPWASCTIDGETTKTTPLTRTLPVGTHTVVCSYKSLTKAQNVLISASGQAEVSFDMRDAATRNRRPTPVVKKPATKPGTKAGTLQVRGLPWAKCVVNAKELHHQLPSGLGTRYVYRRSPPRGPKKEPAGDHQGGAEQQTDLPYAQVASSFYSARPDLRRPRSPGLGLFPILPTRLGTGVLSLRRLGDAATTNDDVAQPRWARAQLAVRLTTAATSTRCRATVSLLEMRPSHQGEQQSATLA